MRSKCCKIVLCQITLRLYSRSPEEGERPGGRNLDQSNLRKKDQLKAPEEASLAVVKVMGENVFVTQADVSPPWGSPSRYPSLPLLHVPTSPPYLESSKTSNTPTEVSASYKLPMQQ